MVRRSRRALPWLLVIAGLVVVAVVAGAPSNPDGEPLDPSSTCGTGTKALVELLESFGATRSTPRRPSRPTNRRRASSSSTPSTRPDTDALDAWVRAGGTLVVADPFSSLSPRRSTAHRSVRCRATVGRAVLRHRVAAGRDPCRPGRVSSLRRVPKAISRVSVTGRLRTSFRVPKVMVGSSPSVEPTCSPTPASIGPTTPWWRPGCSFPSPGTHVALLRRGSGEGSSDRSLTDVLNLGVRLALVQLFVGFVVYAWFRARRLGRAGARDPTRRDRRVRARARGRSAPPADEAARSRGPSVACRCASPYSPSGSGWLPTYRSTCSSTRSSGAPTLEPDKVWQALGDAPGGRRSRAARVGPELGSRPTGGPAWTLIPTPRHRRAAPTRGSRSSRLRDEVAKVVVGQDGTLSGVVAALLVRGHILLEGVPGTAKTLLVKAVAAALDLDFKRVQFTPDLMPSDVIGQVIFEPREGSFRFREGPGVHEPAARRRDQPNAAEDAGRVAGGDGGTPGLDRGRDPSLPEPFVVVATQNPVEYEGTYPVARGTARPVPLQVIGRLSDSGTGRGSAGRVTTEVWIPTTWPVPECGRSRPPLTSRTAREAIQRIRVEEPVRRLHRLVGTGHPREPVARVGRFTPRRHWPVARGQGVGVAGRSATS